MVVVLAGGCRRQEISAAPTERPVIPISHPVSREIADYVYYTGRTDAVRTAEIRARVTRSQHLRVDQLRELAAEPDAGDAVAR
jgi:hypothetical protein